MTKAAFRAVDVSELLRQCHRRCCLCHRFCGVKMEIHHIEQDAPDGGNDRDNAIPFVLTATLRLITTTSNIPRVANLLL